MSRIEENKKVIDDVVRITNDKSSGTYEEVVTIQLNLIAFILADISKSLAMLAGESEKEQERIDMEEAYLKFMMNSQDKGEV